MADWEGEDIFDEVSGVGVAGLQDPGGWSSALMGSKAWLWSGCSRSVERDLNNLGMNECPLRLPFSRYSGEGHRALELNDVLPNDVVRRRLVGSTSVLFVGVASTSFHSVQISSGTGPSAVTGRPLFCFFGPENPKRVCNLILDPLGVVGLDGGIDLDANGRSVMSLCNACGFSGT